jgi:hypothetical protein
METDSDITVGREIMDGVVAVAAAEHLQLQDPRYYTATVSEVLEPIVVGVTVTLMFT